MSATLHLDDFAHNWTARLLASPPLIAPARSFVYPQNVPGEEDALQCGALLAEVRPATGGTFLATCALGFRDPSLPSGLWSCPRADDLLAVAGGYGYRIDTLNPTTLDPGHSEFLPLRPITAVLPAPEAGLILLADFHTVSALGAEGIRWRTARLSWEGITLQKAEGGQLHGLGWDMFTDRELPFRVDLQTGAHEGGGYRLTS